jgi:hypothetical protein
VFVLAFVVQYGLYHQLLRATLRTGEFAQVRPALKRWVKVTVMWQVLVLGGCALYLAALSSRHGDNAAWIAPAVGAAFGTALPLQFVVMALLRSARNDQ